MSEFGFYSISWERIDRIRPNFVYILSLTRSTSVLLIVVFRKFATELWPLIHVRIWFLLNNLRTNWQNETKFCILIIIDKIYFGYINHCFSQICKRVTALDWRHILVFTQCLKNELTEWDQILYTHHHWQDLCWYCKLLFIANLLQRYDPWSMQEFGFCFIYLEWMDRIQPNFVYTLSLTRSSLGF